MPVIDCHVHLYPPEINRDPAGWAAAAGEPHWARLCARVRADGMPVQAFPSVEALLRTMDEAGVDRAVLQGWYWERFESCVRQNRFFAECVRLHSDRLSAFATVHPAAGAAALAEIRRAQEEGLIGLGELSPHSQHVSADDPSWEAILSLAGELGLPVNLHVTDPVMKPYPGRVVTPLEDFVRWAGRHPRTRFILAHWAGGLEVTGLPNVWVDTAAAPLIYRAGAWIRADRDVAMERILFGSDYPLNLYPRTSATADMKTFVNEVRSVGLSPEAQHRILGGNAEAVLNLPRA
ncbi:MAG TPA: amidohydrolase family protein [Opitutaceae bacterium]